MRHKPTNPATYAKAMAIALTLAVSAPAHAEHTHQHRAEFFCNTNMKLVELLTQIKANGETESEASATAVRLVRESEANSEFMRDIARATVRATYATDSLEQAEDLFEIYCKQAIENKWGIEIK